MINSNTTIGDYLKSAAKRPRHDATQNLNYPDCVAPTPSIKPPISNSKPTEKSNTSANKFLVARSKKSEEEENQRDLQVEKCFLQPQPYSQTPLPTQDSISSPDIEEILLPEKVKGEIVSEEVEEYFSQYPAPMFPLPPISQIPETTEKMGSVHAEQNQTNAYQEHSPSIESIRSPEVAPIQAEATINALELARKLEALFYGCGCEEWQLKAEKQVKNLEVKSKSLTISRVSWLIRYVVEQVEEKKSVNLPETESMDARDFLNNFKAMVVFPFGKELMRGNLEIITEAMDRMKESGVAWRTLKTTIDEILEPVLCQTCVL